MHRKEAVLAMKCRHRTDSFKFTIKCIDGIQTKARFSVSVMKTFTKNTAHWVSLLHPNSAELIIFAAAEDDKLV